MAPESMVSVSTASIVEDVLHQHGARLYDLMASRKAEQAATRRNEAANWLRKTVGVVGARDLPESPSEENFSLGLRSGYILCNAMNKVQPAAIPRVIEILGESIAPSEGTPLSSYQRFENIRNFLDVAQDMGLPLFEASDLEKGGNSGRVVSCILALKSFSEWKQSGGNGPWKYSGNSKPANSGKLVVRKNCEPFLTSMSRNSSINEKVDEFVSTELNPTGNFPHQPTETILPQSLKVLVNELLSDKKSEEVPMLRLVEYILSKVMEEFEHRMRSTNMIIASQNAKGNATPSDMVDGYQELSQGISTDKKNSVEQKVEIIEENTNCFEEPTESKLSKEESVYKLEKQRLIIERQQKDIQELKNSLFGTKAGMQFMQMKCSEEFVTLGKHLQRMAYAASGYHKVLEENRKLYNQVQDLKGSIRVYCRIRPLSPGQSCPTSAIGNIDDGSITVLTPSKYGKEGRKSFTFNKVFGPSASQEAVFADTQPLIRSVLDGYNVCIFAYGQTGSGKTYTMTGPKQITPEGQGVNYRALSDLFCLSEERKNTISYEITVQMMEIYNEQVRDLLCSDGHKKVEIRNSSQKGLNVPDATLVPVSSTSDVIELMNLGHRNRAVSATAMNDRSSRSHSCLTVHVQGKDSTSGAIVRGSMHLVDLAGSERVDKSEVVGERLKEAQHINKSLSALGDVIAALSQKGSHVPYRNSKLTQLLQDSLGGQAKTLMFVHISPEADAIGETLSTLKFAERVSTVELGAARLNKEIPEVKELKEQIACLKEALAKKNGEPEHANGVLPSMNFHRKGSLPPLISHTNREQGSIGMAGQARQPKEDGVNIESCSSSSIKQKNPTQDVNLWSGCSSNDGDNTDKEASLHEWVDKVVVSNKEEIRDDDDSLRDWQVDSLQLPDFFYQRNYNVDFDAYKMRSGSATATTDESDDFDLATSDSSETEMLWHISQLEPKAASVDSGSTLKVKKPQARSAKIGSPETRTPIQPHGPLPSRKSFSGPVQVPIRSGRQSAIESSRRRSSTAKIGERK